MPIEGLVRDDPVHRPMNEWALRQPAADDQLMMNANRSFCSPYRSTTAEMEKPGFTVP
jgi:hypothetical protein